MKTQDVNSHRAQGHFRIVSMASVAASAKAAQAAKLALASEPLLPSPESGLKAVKKDLGTSWRSVLLATGYETS